MLEREFAGCSVNHSATIKDLQVVLNHACRYYRIKPPKLRSYNDPSDRCFGYSESDIVDGVRTNPHIFLNTGFHGKNMFTLLHELAHYITDYTWVGHSGHGPKFVGVFMHLLDKYRIVPSDAFRTVAKRRHIKIAGKFKPGAIRS